MKCVSVQPRAEAHRRSHCRVSGSLCAERKAARPNKLFIVGIVIALIAFVIISRVRVPVCVNSASLGWMSEQWLTDHRASHSL